MAFSKPRPYSDLCISPHALKKRNEAMKRIRRLFIGLIVLSFWFNVASAQGQVRPTVSISGPSTPQKDPFDVTITFS